MISQLTIRHLKCFDEVTLGLSNFTLLVGTNSAGKSTVIQSILLAIQNVTDDGNSPLNGRLVSIGDFSDARNFVRNAKSFSIQTTLREKEKVSFEFYEDDDGEVKCSIGSSSDELLQYLHQKNKHIHYFSSMRIGPQDLYQKNYDRSTDYGIFGEYVIDYFQKNKKRQIEASLIKDKTLGSTLGIQVNYWLKHIVNSELSTENIAGTDQVKAQFQSVNNRFVRPKNIGSGLSYIISILISVLSAKMHDLIIIENPEIHLHPKAQSRLTEFLAFAAEQGVRFVVETHSDHIFNGVRKALHKKQIHQENTSVYFFKPDTQSLVTNAVKIEFAENGEVLNHQQGLFDQFDDDINELLGLW